MALAEHSVVVWWSVLEQQLIGLRFISPFICLSEIFFLRPLPIIAWKLAWCLPGIKLFMSGYNLGLSVYMCVFLYLGHARANKGQNAKINDFGKYAVFFVWKSLCCVYIVPEGPNIILFINFYYYYLLHFRQSTWREGEGTKGTAFSLGHPPAHASGTLKRWFIQKYNVIISHLNVVPNHMTLYLIFVLRCTWSPAPLFSAQPINTSS